MAKTYWKSQMKNELKQILTKAGGDITDLIEERYEKSLNAFYNDYTPKIYKRKYGSFYASDGYSKNKNRNKKKIYWCKSVSSNRVAVKCGIMVDDSDIKYNLGSEPYKKRPNDDDFFSAETVLRRTVGEGIHGLTPDEVAKLGWNVRSYPKPYEFPTNNTMENYCTKLKNGRRSNSKVGSILINRIKEHRGTH